eukprot:3086153-Prymnesium_polylepis.1
MRGIAKLASAHALRLQTQAPSHSPPARRPELVSELNDSRLRHAQGHGHDGTRRPCRPPGPHACGPRPRRSRHPHPSVRRRRSAGADTRSLGGASLRFVNFSPVRGRTTPDVKRTEGIGMRGR